jgi:nucleotidyltransferase substrate binding protein (TIGR01987 family)
MLDLTSYQRAIVHLEEALAYCASDLSRNDQKLGYHLRAAAIQAFEFTYELAIKTLKRHLQLTESNPNIVALMTFDELIRRGFELQLLNAEIKEWRKFRRDRGTTSHTYDENKAQDVFSNIPVFLEEARFLYQALESHKARGQ